MVLAILVWPPSTVRGEPSAKAVPVDELNAKLSKLDIDTATRHPQATFCDRSRVRGKTVMKYVVAGIESDYLSPVTIRRLREELCHCAQPSRNGPRSGGTD
jgi:hypothetical protein